MTTELVAHSIRIGPTYVDAAIKALKDVSGVIVIKHGYEINEKDHLHVYYIHRGVSSRNALDELKKEVKIIFGLPTDRKLTNAAWSWTNPNTSIEAFWRYAMYEKGPSQTYARVGATCVYWNVGDEKPSPPPSRPHTTSIIVNQSKVSKVTSQQKQQNFYNKIVKPYVTMHPDKLIDYAVIATLLDNWAMGGFNEMAAPQYIEYAMYNYLKDSGDVPRFFDRQSEWVHRVLARMKK